MLEICMAQALTEDSAIERQPSADTSAPKQITDNPFAFASDDISDNNPFTSGATDDENPFANAKAGNVDS